MTFRQLWIIMAVHNSPQRDRILDCWSFGQIERIIDLTWGARPFCPAIDSYQDAVKRVAEIAHFSQWQSIRLSD